MKLSSTRLTAATNAINTAADTSTTGVQSNLVGSFAALAENVSVVVKTGDEIAKIRFRALVSSWHRSHGFSDTSLDQPRLECAISWSEGKPTLAVRNNIVQTPALVGDSAARARQQGYGAH